MTRARTAPRKGASRLRRTAPAALLLAALALAVPAGWAQSPAGPVSVTHTWRRIYYGALDGRESLIFGGEFYRAKPALGDLDGDGDPDLVLGTAEGHLLYFENRGRPGRPDWRLSSEALTARTGEGEAGEVIAVEANAAPALADIDGDGDLDLFVADATGKLRFYRNEGNRFLPILRLAGTDFLGRSFGRNLVARFADVNGDGLPDLTLGTEQGAVWLLLNVGSRQTPRFCTDPDAPVTACRAPARKLAQLTPEDNAVPAWVDWDGDGDLDLMIGKSDGRLAYHQNIGTAREGVWELREPRFMILDAGGYAAPVFSDLTGDERPDLLLAGDSDRLALYRNQAGPGGAELWIEAENVLRVQRLGGFQSRLHVASGDLTGNGRPDLVIGTRGGQLLVYENAGTGADIALRSPPGPLLPTPQRAYAAPALGDIDGDGDLDLLVGDRNGRLELIRNVGTPQQAAWKLEDLFFGGIDVGANSVPYLTDVDGDGDLDLLVGNSLGHVVFYENTGSPKVPVYVLRNTSFALARVNADAAPAMFTWNAETPPDLVVGSRAGTLLSAVADPARRDDVHRGYLALPHPWEGIRADAYAAPHFVDLTGDGQPDLLLGSGRGTLALWRNEGPRSTEAVARTAPRHPGNVLPGALPERPRPGEPAPAGPGAPPEAILDPIFSAEPSHVAELRLGAGSKPVLADTDGDGRPDLVVGTRMGELLHFRNEGPAANPRWRRTTAAFAGYAQGRNAAPTFHDVDGDGLADLVVGTETGLVYLFRRLPGVAAAYAPPVALRGVHAGRNAVPAFADLDGDGRAELLVGNLKGWVHYYRRAGGTEPAYELVQRRFLDVDVGVNASPVVADLTHSGRPVLLVGSDRGAVTVLVAQVARPVAPGQWAPNKTFLEGLKLPLGSHPALVDLDGDGDLDLLVGSDAGPILFFRNQAMQPR